MTEIIELENEKTGLIRKFPKPIFDSLIEMCLGMLHPADRERSEEQVGRMIGEFLDTNPIAEPLRLSAEALYPELKGEIRFNSFSSDVIQIKIKAWAGDIFGRYGSPVWLVGSCLSGIGRDVDVRVILQDKDFDARFPDRNALNMDVGKQSRIGAIFLGMNLDFQIQKASEAILHEGKPRIRLDACSDLDSKDLTAPEPG